MQWLLGSGFGLLGSRGFAGPVRCLVQNTCKESSCGGGKLRIHTVDGCEDAGLVVAAVAPSVE